MKTFADGKDDKGRTMRRPLNTLIPVDESVNEAREMTRAAVMKKIRDGEWEATQDVKPGKHCEIRNTTNGKKMQIMVKEHTGTQQSFDLKGGSAIHPSWQVYFKGKASIGNPKTWAAELYKEHKGEPITRATIKKKWKENEELSFSDRLLFKPNYDAILSYYEMIHDGQPDPSRVKENVKMEDIKPGQNCEIRDAKNNKRVKVMTKESSWGGAQAEGTVKKLKDGGWWAKNQEGTMKTFKDHVHAKRFAKTGDPENAPDRVDETDQLNELTPRQKAMKQGAITDPVWRNNPHAGSYPATAGRIRRGDPKDQDERSQKRAAQVLKTKGSTAPYNHGVDAGDKLRQKRYKADQKTYMNFDKRIRDVKGPGSDADRAENRGFTRRFKKKRDLDGVDPTARPVGKLPESVSEGFSGWHGSARKSVNELGDARLIVRHKRNVDEEKRGARTRQIESIFIENSEGERFKFPSNNITAAKAMARHVKEGGTPFDDFGQHIYETMEELNQLKKFNRKNRRNDFFEDQQIGEEITSRISGLRNNLKKMANPTGYKTQLESFTTEKSEVPQERIDELKSETTMTYFDESIADSLPYVARVIETYRNRQELEQQVVSLARYVMKNKDDIYFNREVDFDDPESPTNQRFNDPATEVAAMVDFLAPAVKDDELSNMMMKVSDAVHDLGGKYINMAMQAINVIKRAGQVDEQQLESDSENVYETELDAINETLNRYSDTRKLFGA